jgi:hypothetical protein
MRLFITYCLPMKVIEVETQNRDFLQYFTGSDDPEAGFEFSIPGNVTLQYVGKISREGMLPGMPHVFQFALTVSSGVITKVAADWITNKLKARARTIRIANKRLPVVDQEVASTISDLIEAESNDPPIE